MVNLLATARAWDKGYASSIKELQEAVIRWPGGEAPAPVRFKLATYLWNNDQLESAAEQLEILHLEFPQSLFLKSMLLDHAKAPSELTLDEIKLYSGVAQEARVKSTQATLADALEWHEMDRLAGLMWGGMDLERTIASLPRIRFLHATGSTDEANEMVREITGKTATDSKNAIGVWTAMLLALAIEDWPAAERWASRYLELRPAFPMSHLVRMAVGLRTQDPAKTEAALADLLAFPGSQTIHQKCRVFQREGGVWDIQSRAAASSLKVRVDALLWASLVPAAQGNWEQSLANVRLSQRHVRRETWAGGLLWMIEQWIVEEQKSKAGNDPG